MFDETRLVSKSRVEDHQLEVSSEIMNRLDLWMSLSTLTIGIINYKLVLTSIMLSPV